VAFAVKAKSEAGKAVQAWINQLERQAGARVKVLRCDGAAALVFADMSDFSPGGGSASS